VAPAAALGDAASAAAAAAVAAFGGLQVRPLGEPIEEDEQALLDEEFAALLQELLSAGAAADVALAAVTAATGMAPPPAAVAAATEAAAASGDDEMVAVVEQLAAGAAAAAAAATATAAEAAQGGTAATSHAASPTPAAPARQAAAAGREDSGAAGASGSSSSGRRQRHNRSDSDSALNSFLPQLRKYWLRTHAPTPSPAVATSPPTDGPGSGSSGVDEELQCTYALHGDQFVEQHWFQCYTCGLTDSRGCCSACVRVCHAGHDVVYAARSRFFCDCGGENGPRENAVACKCLSAVPVKPTASAAAATASGSNGSSSGSSLVRQGWLLPAARDPCAQSSLAASLPDPLNAAWAFDPQLFPDLYAAAIGTSSGSSRRDKGQQQGLSAGAVQQLLQCGVHTASSAVEQQASALKAVPQSLVSQAARALQPWLAGESSTAGTVAADSDVQQQQQQGPREMMQAVASSTLRMSQLLLARLLRHSSLQQQHTSSSTTSVGASGPGGEHPMFGASVSLPEVLKTSQLLLEGSGGVAKVLGKPAAAAAGTAEADKAPAEGSADSTSGSSGGSSGGSSATPSAPLVELQRVIRLGNMSSSSSRSRTRTSGSEYGSEGGGGSGSRGPDVPAEVAAALEGGMVVQRSAAAARQGQLLAVCRGESVGLMDGRLLAAELCGKDIFTKVGGLSLLFKRTQPLAVAVLVCGHHAAAELYTAPLRCSRAQPSCTLVCVYPLSAAALPSCAEHCMGRASEGPLLQ
jgi:hypothetical protein